MESKKFLKDVSASTLQVAVTQIANLLIFYLISKYISKEEFGFYNWATATLLTIITILSFGMDLVYVKRVASDFKRKITIELHLFHTIFSTAVLALITFLFLYLFPNLIEGKMLFLFILINQVFFTIANSIKLALNGLEEYTALAYVAIFVSIIKTTFILILFTWGKFTLYNIIFIFIFTYVIEFILSIFLVKRTMKSFIRPRLVANEYKALIKESLPQLGTVILSTSSVRIDLILMGLLATSIKTAEYSFALKIVQVSQIPLLIISPILLTRFSKIFKSGNEITNEVSNKLDNFLKIEMIIGILIPLCSVVIWSEFFDSITDNKYGAVNQLTYQIMVIGIPFHYAMNFLWSMAFTQGQLKQILFITIISFSINFSSNFLFIHWFGGEGAALSDLLTSVVAFALYLKITKQNLYRFKIGTPLIALFNGIISALIPLSMNVNSILKLVIATLVFFTLSLITKQLNLKTLINFRRL